MAYDMTISPEAYELIEKWKEAKKNQDGWQAVRLDAEKALMEIYEAQWESIVAELDETDSLTTTVRLGDLNVSIGKDMKFEQADIVGFLAAYPQLIGILFKQEYKADSRAVLRKMNSADQMAVDLKDMADFKDKKPSFSLRK